jgi:hypothetical protein
MTSPHVSSSPASQEQDDLVVSIESVLIDMMMVLVLLRMLVRVRVRVRVLGFSCSLEN